MTTPTPTPTEVTPTEVTSVPIPVPAFEPARFRHLTWDGRAVATVATVACEGVTWAGVAYCGPNDQFSRHIGRLIAENRAKARLHHVVAHTRVLYSAAECLEFDNALDRIAAHLDPAAAAVAAAGASGTALAHARSNLNSLREVHVYIARRLQLRWREYYGRQYDHQDTGEEELAHIQNTPILVPATPAELTEEAS